MTGKPADAIKLDPHVAALRYLTLDSLKCVRAFGVSESGVATGPVLVREVRKRNGRSSIRMEGRKSTREVEGKIAAQTEIDCPAHVGCVGGR